MIIRYFQNGAKLPLSSDVHDLRNVYLSKEGDAAYKDKDKFIKADIELPAPQVWGSRYTKITGENNNYRYFATPNGYYVENKNTGEQFPDRLRNLYSKDRPLNIVSPEFDILTLGNPMSTVLKTKIGNKIGSPTLGNYFKELPEYIKQYSLDNIIARRKLAQEAKGALTQYLKSPEFINNVNNIKAGAGESLSKQLIKNLQGKSLHPMGLGVIGQKNTMGYSVANQPNIIDRLLLGKRNSVHIRNPKDDNALEIATHELVHSITDNDNKHILAKAAQKYAGDRGLDRYNNWEHAISNNGYSYNSAFKNKYDYIHLPQELEARLMTIKALGKERASQNNQQLLDMLSPENYKNLLTKGAAISPILYSINNQNHD